MSEHREAFEEFAEKAVEELGEDLESLVLYGSVAKGEERDDSDVDVFAVVKSVESEEKLEDLAYDTGLEHEVFISVQVQTRERFEARKDHPFIRNLMEEGTAYV